MSTLLRLLGRRSVREDDEGENSLIPDDAKPFVPRSERDDRASAAAQQIASGSAKEPLIDPQVALVAPDATPRATVRLSPSQVPSGPPEAPPVSTAAPVPTGMNSPSAVSAILGRAQRNDSSQTPTVIPGIPSNESFARETGFGGTDQPAIVSESAGAGLAAASVPGGGMPEPAPPSDGRRVMDVLRRFGGPRG